MKRLATALFLILLVAASGTSQARPITPSLARALGINGINGSGTVTIPPEWAGIWSVTDSMYDCQGAFQSVDTVIDTFCAGTQIVDPGESPIQFTCTGTADGTSYNQTCTGTGTVAGCDVTFTFTTHGTRTAETFYSVGVSQQDVSGPSPCDLFPDNCFQVNSHGTRTGPAPPTFCTTPTREATWGKVKLHYR